LQVRPALLLVLVFVQATAVDLLRMPIGDPARSAREVAVTLDAITDAVTGATLTTGQLADRLKDARLVLVGETHTDSESHRVQLRVIEALHAAGRRVLVGLEMYPYTEQPHLDAWVAGTLDEEAFLRASRWYRHWGYHWLYYRDVFTRARDLGLPLVALNTPREVIAAVRTKGLRNLPPDQAAHMPPEIDTASSDHRRLFRAFLEDAGGVHAASMSEAEADAMFAAQCAWDAGMAHHAVQALTGRGESAVVVVLAGTGHVAYGLGIARQAARWFDGRLVSVMPVPIVDDGRRPVERVQASYADFIWGVPGPPTPLFPALGVATRDLPAGGVEVLDVEENTPAAAAGVAPGDVILEMEGTPIRDRQALNTRVAATRWGDEAVLVVRRGADTISVRAILRRAR
jgi:uncharacterized iron-regulated protein